MAGCRDCTTCTKPGAARAGQSITLGIIHIATCGISYLVKRATGRHCPGCSHLLSSHHQRPDQPGWQTPVNQQGTPQQWPPAQPYPPQPGYPQQQPYPPQAPGGWQAGPPR